MKLLWCFYSKPFTVEIPTPTQPLQPGNYHYQHILCCILTLFCKHHLKKFLCKWKISSSKLNTVKPFLLRHTVLRFLFRDWNSFWLGVRTETIISQNNPTRSVYGCTTVREEIFYSLTKSSLKGFKHEVWTLQQTFSFSLKHYFI